MSGVRCSVDFCPSHTGSGASMHRFPPGDGPRRQKWIEFVRGAAGRTEWTPQKSSRICSLHFEPACYKQFLLNTLPPRERCLLEPDAVPSIYVVGFHSEHSSRRRGQKALSDMHHGEAAPPTVWTYPSADWGLKVEKAAGQAKVDAQSQCVVYVSSKGTQAALTAYTKVARVQTTQTVNKMGPGRCKRRTLAKSGSQRRHRKSSRQQLC
ncbi:THAP domain-containing protein 10-like [Haemaphysalis longicornis]